MAEARGALVGYIDVRRSGVPRLDGVGFFEVAVRAAHRGSGLGGALVAAGEGWARDAGLTKLSILVVAENAGAATLYLRLGYRFEGLRRETYRLGAHLADEYVMGKRLGAGGTA